MLPASATAITGTRLSSAPGWCSAVVANPALASAPPNSSTTSLGMGTHADPNRVSTKMAT